MGRKRFAYNETIELLANSGHYKVVRGRLQSNRRYRPGKSITGKRGGGSVTNCKWFVCDRLDGKGYRYLSWLGARPKAHRLIYWLYYGPYDLSLEINHKDGNGLNNTKQNLELVTPREQSEHAYRTGLNSASKLTESDVREIRKRHSTSRISMAELARNYNVTAPTVRAVLTGITWKWLK